MMIILVPFPSTLSGSSIYLLLSVPYTLEETMVKKETIIRQPTYLAEDKSVEYDCI